MRHRRGDVSWIFSDWGAFVYEVVEYFDGRGCTSEELEKRCMARAREYRKTRKKAAKRIQK